jgi:putative SOS response-associated peptidase YedK
MCFHSQQTKDAQSVSKRFKAKVNTTKSIQSNHYNGFTHPQTPIITNINREEIQLFSWGLIPNWAKDKTIQAYTLNAKIETLNEKPSFKNNIVNRCLIIADGFTEWQWLDPKGKQKQPYLITLPNNDLFAYAGLYSFWTDTQTGEIVESYTMVTTQANELMSQIHNTKKRMPIILEPHQEESWLNGENYLNFANCTIELSAKPK